MQHSVLLLKFMQLLHSSYPTRTIHAEILTFLPSLHIEASHLGQSIVELWLTGTPQQVWILCLYLEYILILYQMSNYHTSTLKYNTQCT